MSRDNPFRIPGRFRHDVEQIFTLTDPFCAEYLAAVLIPAPPSVSAEDGANE